MDTMIPSIKLAIKADYNLGILSTHLFITKRAQKQFDSRAELDSLGK